MVVRLYFFALLVPSADPAFLYCSVAGAARRVGALGCGDGFDFVNRIWARPPYGTTAREIKALARSAIAKGIKVANPGQSFAGNLIAEPSSSVAVRHPRGRASKACLTGP